MKENKLTKTLESLGLSANEAAVYLASLSLGPTTVLKLARAAGMKRPTVYVVLESLKQKGLMLVELRGFKQLYAAETPEKLEVVLDERRNKLLRDLPEFMGLYNLKGGESYIKYHEGLEAVKSVYESMIRDIRPHEDYIVVSHFEPVVNLDKDYFNDFFRRRGKLNINIRLLVQDSPMAREYQKLQRQMNMQVKIFPKNTSLVTNLVVTPERAMVHHLREPVFAIVIENQSIIQMHQQLFEIMWNSIE